MEKLRILVADDESVIVMSLKSQLRALGHDVVGEAATGREVVELARTLKPDVAIVDIKMPEMSGIEAARQITAENPIPIVLLTACTERELAAEAADAGILAYLMKPVTEDDLWPAIMLARSRFGEFQMLKREVADLKEALETRKMVEKAKGILMERRNLTETEAFRRLQKQSQDENKKLVEIARAIITADKML